MGFKVQVICDECKEPRMVDYRLRWMIKVGKARNRCRKCFHKTTPKNLDGLKLGHGWNRGLKGFMKGHPAYNTKPTFLGRKHTDEAKKKISLKKIGKPHPMTDETKFKISQSNMGRVGRKGELHHNWRGGITSEQNRERIIFKNTLRKVVLRRDNYTCKICGQHGKNLQVDHIQSWKDNKGLRFELNNCRTLCMNCHYEVTYFRKMPINIKTWGHTRKKVEV